jgi:hypothetical protein
MVGMPVPLKLITAALEVALAADLGRFGVIARRVPQAGKSMGCRRGLSYGLVGVSALGYSSRVSDAEIGLFR